MDHVLGQSLDYIIVGLCTILHLDKLYYSHIIVYIIDYIVVQTINYTLVQTMNYTKV